MPCFAMLHNVYLLFIGSHGCNNKEWKRVEETQLSGETTDSAGYVAFVLAQKFGNTSNSGKYFEAEQL